jgi:transposase InsO family protein
MLDLLKMESASSVIRKAQREGWHSRLRPGRGGGYEWLLLSLPDDTRQIVSMALVGQQAALFERPAPVPAAVTSGLPGLAPALPPASKQDRAAARAVIVQLARNYAASQHPLPRTYAYENFALRYNGGDLAVPDWARASVRSLCRATLNNWERALDAAGLESLGETRGRNRIGTGAVDQPYVLGYVLAHIYRYPHAGPKQIYKDLSARLLLKERPERLPSLRRMQVWYHDWRKENAEIFLYISNPDKWRNACRVAMGDATMLVDAPNQEWEMDSTPADLILADGKRHTIVACLDVYTRRVIFHVSRTSSSHAVAACLSKAILAWGIPDLVRTDNGKDYVSRHIAQVLLDMGIYHDICAPFCPEQKPCVERVFRTLLHDDVELLHGYVGHNVSERKALEARKSFAQRMRTPDAKVELNVSAEELQAILDRWSNDSYMHTLHGTLGCTPYEQARAYDGPIRRVESPDALRLLCLPLADGDGTRVVRKDGIHLHNDHYIASELGLYIRRTVQVRVDDVDEADCRQIHVYSLDGGQYICTARGMRHDHMSATDIRNTATAARAKQNAQRSGQLDLLREAAKAAHVEEAVYERRLVAELRARQIEKEEPLRAEMMNIHSTPALEGAAQAAARPDYTPAPMTEAERASHAATLEAIARVTELPSRTETAEARYLRYLSLPPDDEWGKRYRETAECRTQQLLHELYGEGRIEQLRAMGV